MIWSEGLICHKMTLVFFYNVKMIQDDNIFHNLFDCVKMRTLDSTDQGVGCHFIELIFVGKNLTIFHARCILRFFLNQIKIGYGNL